MQNRDFNWCKNLVEGIAGSWPQVRLHVDRAGDKVSHDHARFFFGRGWARDFASIGDSSMWPLRLQIRSNAPALPEFTRAHPAGNWWWIAAEAIAPEALEPLLRESYRLAQLRNCGVVATDPLDETHVLLRAGLKASVRACWPPPPWHLGGPKPTCPPKHQRSIGAWCWELMKAIAEPQRRAMLDKLSGGKTDHGSADSVRFLIKVHADDPARTRALLEELDRRILIGELVERRSNVLPASSETREIARVLWRGTDSKGEVSAWIAELEGGGCGLLAKIGRRWCWQEGDRDSILATVPDAQFESAVEALASFQLM